MTRPVKRLYEHILYNKVSPVCVNSYGMVARLNITFSSFCEKCAVLHRREQ
jgi:hypothetical protein